MKQVSFIMKILLFKVFFFGEVERDRFNNICNELFVLPVVSLESGRRLRFISYTNFNRLHPRWAFFIELLMFKQNTSTKRYATYIFISNKNLKYLYEPAGIYENQRNKFNQT